MKHIYIIAEAGVNHNGSIDNARKMIDAAKQAGADAVKFQTFRTGSLVSGYAQKAGYQKRGSGEQEASQQSMLEQLELTFDEFAQLKRYCDDTGINFLTTPFDMESADFAADLVNIFKIASGEITNPDFLQYIAGKGRPVILSTGMSTLGEVEAAVRVIKDVQNGMSTDFPPLTLLHCTTNYPCPYEEVNLNAMLTLRDSFKLPVGYSDHTPGIEVPVAAAALGAGVIEKHFTLDRYMPGPDHRASLEPGELAAMVQSIRHIEQALGDGIKQPNRSELEIMPAARKGIVAKHALKAGTVLTAADVAVKRPAQGIAPGDLSRIIGMKILRDKQADENLYWEDFKDV